MPEVKFEKPLTASEQEFFTRKFTGLDKETLGIVTGEAVKPLFAASNLSPQKLSQVWMTVDVNNNGFLNFQEFSAACRMIGHLQKNPNNKIDKHLYSRPPRKLVKFDKLQDINNPNTTTSIDNNSLSSSIDNNTNTKFDSSKRKTSNNDIINLTSSPQVDIPPLITLDESIDYGKLFEKSSNDPNLKTLPGPDAREIFLKFNLPTQILGEIWALCDHNFKGSLEKNEFIMAMHLLNWVENNPNVKLPTQLSKDSWLPIENSLINNNNNNNNNNNIASPQPQLHQTISNQNNLTTTLSHSNNNNNISRISSNSYGSVPQDWILTADKKEQFDQVFDRMDENNEGYLTSDVLVPFFMSSKLDHDILAEIWDLADINNTTEFTKIEFALAMFLIQKKNSGTDLPTTLPNELINSPCLGLVKDDNQQLKPLQQQINTPPPQTNNSTVGPPPSLSSNLNSASSRNRAISNTSSRGTPVSEPRDSFQSAKDLPLPQHSSNVNNTTTPNNNIELDKVTELPTSNTRNTSSIDSLHYRSSSNSELPNLSNNRPILASHTGVSMPNHSNIPITSNATGSRLDMSYHLNTSSVTKANVELAGKQNELYGLQNQHDRSNQKRLDLQKQLEQVDSLKANVESQLATLRIAENDVLQEIEKFQNSITIENQEIENINLEITNIENAIVTAKQDTASLTEELNTAQENKINVQEQVNSLSQELEQLQEKNNMINEEINEANTEAINLQTQLSELQQNIRQERSIFPELSSNLQNQQIGTSDIEEMIKALEEKFEMYLGKQKELDDYETKVETQHSKLEERYKDFEQRETELKNRENQLEEYNKQIEEQESEYKQNVQNLEEMFDDFNKRKSEFEEETSQYSIKVRELAEKQMRLASMNDSVKEEELKLAAREKENKEYSERLLEQHTATIPLTRPVNHSFSPRRNAPSSAATTPQLQNHSFQTSPSPKNLFNDENKNSSDYNNQHGASTIGFVPSATNPQIVSNLQHGTSTLAVSTTNNVSPPQPNIQQNGNINESFQNLNINGNQPSNIPGNPNTQFHPVTNPKSPNRNLNLDPNKLAQQAAALELSPPYFDASTGQTPAKLQNKLYGPHQDQYDSDNVSVTKVDTESIILDPSEPPANTVSSTGGPIPPPRLSLPGEISRQRPVPNSTPSGLRYATNFDTPTKVGSNSPPRNLESANEIPNSRDTFDDDEFAGLEPALDDDGALNNTPRMIHGSNTGVRRNNDPNVSINDEFWSSDNQTITTSNNIPAPSNQSVFSKTTDNRDTSNASIHNSEMSRLNSYNGSKANDLFQLASQQNIVHNSPHLSGSSNNIFNDRSNSGGINDSDVNNGMNQGYNTANNSTNNIFHSQNNNNNNINEVHNNSNGNIFMPQAQQSTGSMGSGNGLFATEQTAPLQIPNKQQQDDKETQQNNIPIDLHKFASTPRSLAIEELSAMGFSTEEATQALVRTNWDLSAAQNDLMQADLM